MLHAASRDFEFREVSSCGSDGRSSVVCRMFENYTRLKKTLSAKTMADAFCSVTNDITLSQDFG